MAIDTKAKRMSAMNFGDGTTVHLLPESDGTIDPDDQQHLLDCYSGILFDPVTPSEGGMFNGVLGDGHFI